MTFVKTALHTLFLLTVSVFSLILFTYCSGSHETASGIHNGEVRIIATDDGYELPDSVLAGMVHIVFENRGSTIHEAMFIRLPDNMTGEDYLEAVSNGADFPEGAIDYAGPGLTSPGEKVETWLSLDPGNYILACWFTGHLTSMPVHTLTVHKRESSGITPPKEDAILRLIDFRFELEGQLRKGAQVLRVETIGPSMHEVDIFRLKDGRTLDDLREWQKKEKKGPAPAVAVGGVLDNHDIRRVVWIRTNFHPGQYVLWCNMPMVANNPGPGDDVTHADAGMFKEFVIED